MSGCCGPSPVIVNGPTTPRVDVEGSLLCDVLPDGTVTGQVLVEAVYDTSSGERIGTRPVDPVTGADYTVQGTLRPCPPPEQCTCQTVLLCHTPQVPIPGPATSPVPLTATGQPTTHTISGAPRQGEIADATAIWAGQTVSVPGSAPGGSDAGAHTHYTVALAPGTPDCGTLDPAGTVEITAAVTYTNDGPGGGWDWYGRLSLWVEGDAAPVAADNFGQGSGAFFTAGSTRTATITGTVPVAALQAGDVSVEFDLETGADPDNGTPEGGQPKTWTVTGATLTTTAAVTGCTLGEEPADPVPFLRHICRTCSGTATVTDTTLDGTTTYDTSTGTVGVCGPTSATGGLQVVERCGCDDVNGDGTLINRYVELWSVDPGGQEDPALLGSWLEGDFTQPYTPANPVDCPAAAEDCDRFIGTLCYQAPATQDPSFTLHKFNDADPNHPGCLVGLDALDGDFPFIQYNDPITAWEGTYTSNTGTTSNVEVSAPELGGFIDWSTFSPPIPSIPNPGIPAPYTGTAVFNGITVTLEVFTATAITTGSQYLRMGGTLHFKLSFSSPVTMRFGTQGFADPASGNDERFCDVTATGVVTGAGEIRTAYGLRDCTTGEATWRDQVSGAEVDLAQAVVVPCPQPQRDCASPTEPTATVGLCLADGTPIAVTVIRDCTGAVTSEGWLNLTTGAWTAGAVPIGTVACGDSRSIQVSGTFCAVEDATADVVGLVLVEYTYDDTGAIADVRLVDAVTGTTYTPPAGVTVTVCPTGTEQPEQDAVVLCRTAADGTVTTFVRDYRRDETGAITAHSDYLLDGTTYTPDPTGTVGVCQPDTCTDCETLLLCDVPTTAPERITGTAASGTLSNGVSWTSTSPTNVTYAPQRNNADGSWWGMPSFPLSVTTPTRWTFDRPVFVEFSVYVAYYAANPALSRAQLPAGLEPVSLPTGYAYDPATGVLTRTSDGDPADPCSYTTDPQVAGSARFRTTSAVTTFTTAPAPNSRVARCGIFFTYWSGAVSVQPGGPFLRHICRSCDGTPTVTDTLVDGVTPYLPAGTVGQCQTGASSSAEPEACHNTTTVLLCAAPADGTTDVTPAITDSDVAAIGQTQFQNHPGPYTPLWTGGTLVYPAGPGPAQEHLAATGQLTADVAGCEDAAGTLTVSVRVRNDGPDDGQAWDGALRLFRGTTQIAAHNALEWAPVGWQGTLTVSAPVTAAEVAAGDIRVSVQLETYHLGAKQWTADQFTASLELEGCALTAPVQILRNVVTDCTSGEVVSTYDTTLDGEPYDVGTGEVSQCQPVTQPQEPGCCPTSETVHLCHTSADGTVVTEFVRDYHRDATGIITGHSDYTLDGADFVADPAGAVGQCRPVDCTSTPLCVRPSGVVEFISNADNRTTGDVDPVWKWSSMSLAGPWYDMYQVGVYPGWTVTDAGTPGGTAHWVALHPNSTVTSTNLPGEGPTLTAANPDWYARASFDLPPFADPATIQVAATVLNADQLAVEWRLNDGPWQAVGRNHQPPAYTFGPAAVPGAQAGTNTIYVHGRETVFNGGAAGVMMHLVVTYDVDATAYEQWLRTSCSDGSITYLDGDGNPQPGIPADSTIVPCPGGSGGDGFDVETWPLCILDASGAVVQQVRAEQVYDTAGAATGAPRLVDAVTGDPAAIPAGGSVTVCPTGTPASGRQLVERCGCSDEDGDGIAETRYVELWSVDPEGVGTPLLVGTHVEGDFNQPITPAAPMDCPAGSSGGTAAVVSTGARSITGTAPVDLAAEFPGLQSVTLLVSSGSVLATLTDGTNVPIPAGANVTWSIIRDEDTALDAAAFAGADVGTTYLLLFTYTA